MAKLLKAIHEWFKRHPRARNVLEGISLSFDPLPLKQPSYEERFGTDEDRLRDDWCAVDNDMRTAIKKVTATSKPPP